jgi:hypothetical protein
MNAIERSSDMRVGIFDHFGWAVAVTANSSHDVVDRRRIDLVEPGLTAAPIHYDGDPADVAGTAALVARVRASAARSIARALDNLSASLPEPVQSVSLRVWPTDFPDDIRVQLRPPYEARADAIMYRRILASAADERGWLVCRYSAKDVEAQAAAILGDRADDVVSGPRRRLGPPWTKDHRIALAATVVCG